MPNPSRFVDNPFDSRSQFQDACVSLLESLKPYQSDGGARIALPIATGTHFDATAAQLEGFARPLWAVASLVRGKCLTEEQTKNLVEPYVRGLANGTDPCHPEYWGPVGNKDQRMVEMEIIAFALLAAPDQFFHSQPWQAQLNIVTWLKAINEKEMPVTNWLWFRVMTNLALTETCGVSFEEVQGKMNEDLDTMDRFYLDEGWSADGIWDKNGRQADYYSGSFAIQFSQLLYASMARDLDPERCARFEERALAFASSFWRYFDSNGASIPFGRSLTYRFASAAFWSVAAFAGVEFQAPLDDMGVVKHLLLQHFRWWSKQSDIFYSDGTLSIGYCYPNMYMSEDYNSPQSPYWAMKSFIALALPESHSFWSCPEQTILDDSRKLATIVKPPMHIVCSGPNHHFLLSSGQFCPWPLKATEAKYGKFAYSSAFGFSVPTGTLLPQIAPDSTIALSKDSGDTWRLPWKVEECGFRSAQLYHKSKVVEEIPAIVGLWRLWSDVDVVVRTALIAPSRRWPDWYIRAHTITNNEDRELKLNVVEGGFALPLDKDTHSERGIQSFANSDTLFRDQAPTGISTFPERVVCRSSAGVSGIKRLEGSYNPELYQFLESGYLKPDANTNLMVQKTLIPVIKYTAIPLGRHSKFHFASGVFAVAQKSDQTTAYNGTEVEKRWDMAPLFFDGSLDLSRMGPADIIGFKW